MFCSIAIYDVVKGLKMSENFYFELNDAEYQVRLTEWMCGCIDEWERVIVDACVCMCVGGVGSGACAHRH